jgi:hypothetical protein
MREVRDMNNQEAKEIRKGERMNEDQQPTPQFTYKRRQTGIRILATLFFGIVVWSILETIVFVMVIFQMIYTLIAERPNFWLIGFANRTIAYFYRVMRYLTFNEDSAPFPFTQFPAEIEKPDMK